MDIANPLFLGIGSSIAATVITSAAWWGWSRIKKRDHLISFLKLSGSHDIVLFYGSVHREELSAHLNQVQREYATFEYGDIAACLLVYDRLRTVHGLKIIHAVGTNHPNLLKGNVISIGGPKWNKVTEKLIGTIGSPLYFNADCSGTVEKRKLHRHENCHEPRITPKKETIQTICDYGIIVCARSEFLGQSIPFAITIAGYSTYGVLIASEYLVSMSKSDIKRLQKRFNGDKRFSLLVKGTAEVDALGHVVSISQKELVSEIPEKDFLEPRDYNYSSSTSMPNQALATDS